MVAEMGFEPHDLTTCGARKNCASQDAYFFDRCALLALASSRTAGARRPSKLFARGLIPFGQIKRKSRCCCICLCVVAEMGFEPHDLRVMSPTSYRTALLRDIDLIANIEYHSFFQMSREIFANLPTFFAVVRKGTKTPPAQGRRRLPVLTVWCGLPVRTSWRSR